MSDLTERQIEILKYIFDFQVKHYATPSVREICAHIGLSSTSTVDYQLKALEHKGYIERSKGAARMIKVLGLPEVLISQ